MKIRHFEVDCRKFLLAVNSSIARKLVFSLPVLRCKLRSQELFKPPGENYPTFWADFNMGSSSISLYCVQEKEVEEGMSWDLVGAGGWGVPDLPCRGPGGCPTQLHPGGVLLRSVPCVSV